MFGKDITNGTKLGNEERRITGKRGTAIKLARSRRAHGGLQHCWTGYRGEGGATHQAARGRMGFGTVCKAETSRVKNISIESSEGKKIYVFGFSKTVY
jgi:hypothetical protein